MCKEYLSDMLTDECIPYCIACCRIWKKAIINHRLECNCKKCKHDIDDDYGLESRIAEEGLRPCLHNR
jgi:hypothetical protein